MSRGKCSICGHPQSMAINASLEAGLSQLAVAAEFAVSKFALSRHKNRCLAPSAEAVSASPQSQLDRWLARADDLYLSAAASGDLRAQASAMACAIRSLQSSLKQEERQREEATKENDLLPSGEHRLTVEGLDRAVETYLKAKALENHSQ